MIYSLNACNIQGSSRPKSGVQVLEPSSAALTTSGVHTSRKLSHQWRSNSTPSIPVWCLRPWLHPLCHNGHPLHTFFTITLCMCVCLFHNQLTRLLGICQLVFLSVFSHTWPEHLWQFPSQSGCGVEIPLQLQWGQWSM